MSVFAQKGSCGCIGDFRDQCHIVFSCASSLRFSPSTSAFAAGGRNARCHATHRRQVARRRDDGVSQLRSVKEQCVTSLATSAPTSSNAKFDQARFSSRVRVAVSFALDVPRGSGSTKNCYPVFAHFSHLSFFFFFKAIDLSKAQKTS